MKFAIAALVSALLLVSARAETITSSAGAHAQVSSRYASQFRALIAALEHAGASIKFMGGIRPGYCGQASKHPCGMALDVCQLSRGVVDARCHLPGRSALSAIAARVGLFSGGDWCNSDYGHVEAGGSVACGRSWASLHGGSTHETHLAGFHRRGVGNARIRSAASGGPSDMDFR